MKLFLLLLLGAFLLLASCKKSNHTSESNIKIAVIAGNGQSDTVGRVLRDSIRISVTRGSMALPKAMIKIVEPGCTYSTTAYLITGSDGTAAFPWQLNPTIGSQELMIYAVDSLNNVLDSTTATATGLFVDSVWLPASCLPQNANGVQSFASLSSGRVMFSPNNQIYYSDDNGGTWSVLTSFPGQGGINNINVYGHDIFALNSQNLLYSPDSGSTWQSLSPVSSFGYLTTLGITQSGKMFLSASSGVHMSLDLGQTWTNISTQPNNSIGYSEYYFDFCESADGTIFTVNDSGELWFSEDSGLSWVHWSGFYSVDAVFSDNSGTAYVSNSLGMEGMLYRVGKSGGSLTLTTVCSFPNTPGQAAAITNISEVNNAYYFILAGYGLMKTTDFVSFRMLLPAPLSAYCITNTGAGIAAEESVANNAIIYNIHP
jgi:hypothetical protein